MVILDIKDKKILYHLSQNARISRNFLAKKTRLSNNSIRYRIERLLKGNIIKNFTSVINLKTLGYTTVTIILRLNEDIYESKKTFDFLKEHPYVDWMIALSGDWDAFIELAVRDFKHLDDVLREIIESLGEILNDYKVFFSTETLRVEHLPEEFYHGILKESIKSNPRKEEMVKTDKIDKKILDILTKNSSLPYLAISRESNISFDVVRYRINNLIKKGVLIKFFPELDLSRLGYTEYLYTIKLKSASLAQIKKIKNYLKINPSITYAFNDCFGFNLVFTCAFKNPIEVDNLVRTIRKQFGKIIDSQEYLIIREQIKFNLFPTGLLTNNSADFAHSS